jgi:CRP-like cAMP-binding protein
MVLLIMDLLNNILFDNLEEDLINLIPANSILINKKINQIIVEEGGLETPNLYILKSGAVAVVKTDLDGYETFLSLKKSNEVFGYLSIVDYKPRNGKCITLTDCEYWQIDGFFVKKFLLQSIQFNLNLMNFLTSYIRMNDNYIRMAINRSAQKKILFKLLELGDISNDGSKCTIKSYINQSIISSFIGLARETVSREIRKLKEMGIIEVNNGNNMRLDIEKAENLLEKGIK